MSYPSDELKDDIDALTTGAHRLSEAANAIATITSGSDVVVENFDHLEEVLDNLQAFFDTLKGSTFYPPVGSISPFAGASAYTPPGWLLCQGTAGTAVTSASFPDLYNVLTANGTVFPYGGSAGTTYTPDLRGRVPFGLNSANSVVDSLADKDSVADASRGPNHTHDLSSHTHTVNSHSHSNGSLFAARTMGGGIEYFQTGGSAGWQSNTRLATGSPVGDSNFFNGGTKVLGDTSAVSTGTTGPSNNTSDSAVIPYVTVNYIIFAGKV